MKSLIKWNAPADRTTFILTALATLLAIHLFPIYFTGFLQTAIRGVELGAVRLIINALVTPLFLFLISLPLVVVTRRRLIDLNLTAAFAFTFPIWVLSLVVNAPVLSLLAFPLSGQKLLTLSPAFWISIIPLLFMAAVPGRTSGGPPTQKIYQKLQHLTETRSRINAKDFRKKVILLLGLAFTIAILPGLIRKLAGITVMPQFVLIPAGIAVLLTVLMITIYAVRRLNDLDRSYLWAGFIPLYLQNIITVSSLMTLYALQPTGLTGAASSLFKLLFGFHEAMRYYNIAAMAACVIVLVWLMIEKTSEYAAAPEDPSRIKAPDIYQSPVLSPAKAILGMIVAVLSVTAIYKYLHPYDTIRYRMTVTIQTPEGLQTGTVVRQANFERGSNNKATKSIGEAVAIDLGDRGTVFALLDTANTAYGVSSTAFCANPDFASSKARVGSKLILPEEAYPKFVVFKDVSNPKTMQTLWEVTSHNGCQHNNSSKKPAVINDQTEELLGKSVKIRQVSLEITKDSVTDNIQKALPWLYCKTSSKGEGKGFTLHKHPVETILFHMPPRGAYKKLAKSPEAAECDKFHEDWAAYDRKKFQDELAYLKQYTSQGIAIAQYETGKLVAKGDGHGIAPDRAEALKWYRLAADQGYHDAQAKLAKAYAGKGSKWEKAEDTKQAYFWALLASLTTGGRDTEPYEYILKTAPQHMTPDEKYAVEESVRAWRPSATSMVVVDTAALSRKLLDQAQGRSDSLIPKLLIERGADINIKNETGQSVLMLATDAGNLDLVEFLINRDADVNAINHQGQTALFMAARKGRSDIVSALLKAGIQSRLRDGSGETADKAAERNNHIETSILIQQAIKSSMPGQERALAAPARPTAPPESPIKRVRENTEVHYIGVYRADVPPTDTEAEEADNSPAAKAVRAARTPRTTRMPRVKKRDNTQPGKIDVAITRRGAPMIVVLTSYEPVHWVLSPAYGVNISGVILSGYHKQSVEGVPPNVPVLNTSHEKSETPGVRYFYGYDPSSPDLPSLMKRIEDLTGVPQYNIFFTGTYKDSGFEIR